MPGLSVAYVDGDVDGSVDGGPDGTLGRALAATLPFDHYEASTTRAGDRVTIGRTEYEGYPIREVDTEHGTAILEGRLYDVSGPDVASSTEAALERVASLVAADDVEGLREWVGARDGDYLVAVVDGDDVSVLTDPFARLPAYHATIDGTTVCSRELSVIHEVARRRSEPLALDRLAIGQLLAFGYPLGTRTPFEGVRSVPPGSLLSIDGAGAVDVTSLYEHDFDDTPNADRSLEANADELAERIAAACRRRTSPDRRTVVSLSGGLDSRAVAAAYAGGNESVDAATFQREGGRNADEIAAAGAVAAQLGLDWSVYTARSSPERRETLLRTKLGTNYLGMAFVLDFLEQLRERYGTTTYVTGDGGDKLLVDLEPAATPGSRRELVDHAIEANSRLPLVDAAAIANVDPEAIRASVARRFASYPESDRSRRYVHFLLRERGINFLVHGEDRNRYYAWTVAPFYALPVFEYAMACPDDQKAYRRLQSAILDRFDPALLDLPYPNFGAPVSTRRYRVKQFVYDALERSPALRERVLDLVTDDAADHGPVTDAIRADLPRLDAAGLSSAHATDVVEASEEHSSVELELLATVAALAGEIVDDRLPGPDDRTAEPPARYATGPGSGVPADGEANGTATPTDDATASGAAGDRSDASRTPSSTGVDR